MSKHREHTGGTHRAPFYDHMRFWYALLGIMVTIVMAYSLILIGQLLP